MTLGLGLGMVRKGSKGGSVDIISGSVLLEIGDLLLLETATDEILYEGSP